MIAMWFYLFIYFLPCGFRAHKKIKDIYKYLLYIIITSGQNYFELS